MRKAFKHPVLRMSLDLSNPVDAEVYNIFKCLKSGAESKNYLCSAILYYARSPLVLSAGVMERLSILLDKVYTALQENPKGANVQESFDFGPSDPVLYKELMDIPVPNVDKSKLTSLRDKFKI